VVTDFPFVVLRLGFTVAIRANEDSSKSRCALSQNVSERQGADATQAKIF
jgi:hypothetical protein